MNITLCSSYKTFLLSIFISSTFFSETAFALPASPSGKKWVEVSELTDDFNSFNTNKWQKGHPYWSGRAPSVYNNNNIAVHNGLLRLNMSVKDSSQNGNWIWAACVTSKEKSFTKGMYSEVKVRVANLSATSSFWMQGAYSEIDVIENYGNVINNTWRHLDYTMESNTHYFPNGWANDQKTQKHFTNPNNARHADRYNTYGVWWKDNRNISFYRDGVEVGSVYTGGNFDEPMYMFFDMETFTWGPGIPTQAQLNDGGKNSAYYDYVKTYRLVNTTDLTIPGRIEAEAYSAQNGVQTENTTDSGGGKNVGYIENGDYIEFDVNVVNTGNYEFSSRVASAGSGGNIFIVANGSNLGSIYVSNNGGWQNWTTLKTTVYLNAGRQKLRLNFSGVNNFLYNINWIDIR
jgi:Carbohydrate binding module (family 6)